MERFSFEEITDLEFFNDDLEVLPECQIVVVNEIMERKDFWYTVLVNNSNKNYYAEKP